MNELVTIQFEQGAAGERNFRRGDITQWDKVEALRLEAAGIARILETPPSPENEMKKTDSAETFTRHMKKGKQK